MRKFLQFLTPAHIMAVAIIIYSVVRPPENEPILVAVQLLWIYFQVIVGTSAALAPTTDPESSVLLNQKPDKKADPLFTINMTKQILGQLYYQSAIILIFHEHHSDIVRTFVFNVFVFAQIFNSFNCRRLDQKLNVFEGMWRNWYFMAIITIGVVVQVLVCSIGGSAFGVTHMHAREWVISVALSSSCERCFKWLQLVPPEPELLGEFRC
ncbi:hypothetical protein EDB84DRAFT_1511250 [Lactarius hengduanensis]|nr:hypothetical protein EDB84DRAFT_1511250 [Lactarius hengduanensis]